ncbi:MAG: hypothetical protein WBN90_09260 [Gammaproteobacteria bacterium]
MSSHLPADRQGYRTMIANARVMRTTTWSPRFTSWKRFALSSTRVVSVLPSGPCSVIRRPG